MVPGHRDGRRPRRAKAEVWIAERTRAGLTFYRLAAGPAPNHTARLGANVAAVRGPLGNLLHHRMEGAGAGRITLSPCCMDVSAWALDTLNKRREEGVLCIALEPVCSATSMLSAACVERGRRTGEVLQDAHRLCCRSAGDSDARLATQPPSLAQLANDKGPSNFSIHS